MNRPSSGNSSNASTFVTQPRPYVAPRNPTEHALAGIWMTVLEVDRVGIHDNFVDLGGDSISAERCVSRIRRATEIEIPVEALFTEDANIATLAEYIDTAAGQP